MSRHLRASGARGLATLLAAMLVACGSRGPEDGGAEGSTGEKRGPTAGGEPHASDLIAAPARSRMNATADSTFLDLPEEEILAAIGTRVPVSARATGGTSLSLHLNLEGEIDAAYKPETRRGQDWAGEIAAYRLGLALGIRRVPPAISRPIRIDRLRQLLEEDSQTLATIESDAIIRPDGTVRGAAIYWVPRIFPAEVDRLDQLETWTRWLRQGQPIPADRLSLAQQLSDTIVFDYVEGNWDRWSGGNVLLGPDQSTLLIMDNNAAFVTKLSPRMVERLGTPIRQVERFGARLYGRLGRLTEDGLRRELAADPAGATLLSDEQIAAVLERRDFVVDRVEALARQHGRSSVLCFP